MSEKAIRTYLNNAVTFYASRVEMRRRAEYGPEALVLAYGSPYSGTPWSAWKGTGYRRRKAKQCFLNAARFESQYGLTYVEGFAHSIIPVHHAWCVTADGRVVDPTWHDADETTSYLGIPFPVVRSAELFLMDQGNHLDALMMLPDRERAKYLKRAKRAR
jgi:hypothetical protein